MTRDSVDFGMNAGMGGARRGEEERRMVGMGLGEGQVWAQGQGQQGWGNERREVQSRQVHAQGYNPIDRVSSTCNNKYSNPSFVNPGYSYNPTHSIPPSPCSRIVSISSNPQHHPRAQLYQSYDNEWEYEYDSHRDLNAFGGGVPEGYAVREAGRWEEEGEEEEEEMILAMGRGNGNTDYTIRAGPPADYYQGQPQPRYPQVQQQSRFNLADHRDHYVEDQQQQQQQAYLTMGMGLKASYHHAQPPVMNRDMSGQYVHPHVQQQVQAQAQVVADPYAIQYLPIAEERYPDHRQDSFSSEYYGQEQAQYVQEQVTAQVAPSPEEAVATSGVGLSGWLAEAVWELCLVPFEPEQRMDEDELFEEGIRTPPQFRVGHQLDQVNMKPFEVYGYGNDYSEINYYGGQYGGYSSPDLVSLRELNDPSSVQVSPIMTTSLCANPFNLRSRPSPAFVDFVHRTLSQTLLSPTAVVLALWYIKRLAVHSGGGSDGVMLRQLLQRLSADVSGRGGEEAVRRILTLGLACSNKWLDDNTFTNKSWSDVTQLPLAEFNRLELHALGPLKFDLSVSAKEWEFWLTKVERKLTPFVTDGPAVQSAVHSMHQALRQAHDRFEDEVVSRRAKPIEPSFSYISTAPSFASVDSVLPHGHNDYHLPPIYPSEYNTSAIGHGFPANGFGQNGYISQLAATTPPQPQYGFGQEYYAAPECVKPRTHPQTGYRTASANYVQAAQPPYAYLGHHHYLSHLAASHQPQLFPVMA